MGRSLSAKHIYHLYINIHIYVYIYYWNVSFLALGEARRWIFEGMHEEEGEEVAVSFGDFSILNSEALNSSWLTYMEPLEPLGARRMRIFEGIQPGEEVNVGFGDYSILNSGVLNSSWLTRMKGLG